MSRFLYCCLLLLAWDRFCPVAGAHPVSLSSALVELSPDVVRIEMQIMLEDLVLYHGLSADGQMQYGNDVLLETAEKHRLFVVDYFQVLDQDGNRIPGKVEDHAFDQIGDQPVAQGELMSRSISFLLTYDLKPSRPAYLTFLQIFGGPKSALPAMMDLYITRNEQFEESAQLAYNRPHTIKIDWDHNPEGKRLSLTELRQIRRDQLRDRLGISSFSGLYSFLYINRFEVRHEILIPLLTLDQFVPIPRSDPDFLEVEEQQATRQAIEQFFRAHGTVNINGQVVEPTVQRISFFSLNIADFALNADPRRIGVYQGRVGIIVSYPSRHVPTEVLFDWETFSQSAPFVDTCLLIGNRSPERFYFHPQATRYQWQGDLVGPSISPVRSDKSLASESERGAVMGQLLSNIYRAFDYRADEDIYDSLAGSVSGPLLRDLYLRIKRSLIVAEQGGDLSHATEVVVTDCRPVNDLISELETTWKVTSVSEHWGHIHTRTTQHRARLRLVSSDGLWKLEQFKQLDEQRLSFETSIRGNEAVKP